MLEIVNRQRKVKINVKNFRKFTVKAVEIVGEPPDKSLTIAFVSDRQMRILNQEFRGKNATTDVLSFPFEADHFDFLTEAQNNLGDVVISAEQAAKQAEENGLALDLEIKQLILHGILHLCGYDHERDAGEMNRLELDLRDKLGIS